LAFFKGISYKSGILIYEATTATTAAATTTTTRDKVLSSQMHFEPRRMTTYQTNVI
jgi:hypothetical protein